MPTLFDLPFEEPEPDPVSPPQPDPAPSPGVQTARADARAIWSVTDLTLRVRDALEAALGEVWVEGELSNCRAWNGHLYFTLKDATSQLRGFMFRSALRYLKFKAADGQRVVARGRISVYEPRGEYQLVCDHLDPQGLGALQLAFEQLKERLKREGLFDAPRKRPLPALPRKIGIVTSLEGAALRDMLQVLGRRHGNAHLVIRPARVQGDGSAMEIARALKAVAAVEGVDVVIVGRGGGSIEDLWAFNEEAVARAIAACPVPVIAAVGHETDFTIADFVADMRAPTPSAAAELVVAATQEFYDRIDRLQGRLMAAARGGVQARSRRIHAIEARPGLAGFPVRVAMRVRHASELRHALARLMRAGLATRARRLQQTRGELATFDLGLRLPAIRARLIADDGRLAGAMAHRHRLATTTLRDCATRLETLSPLAVLGRGYAVCWNADRTRVIRRASSAAPGDRVRVTLEEGELDCEVRRSST